MMTTRQTTDMDEFVRMFRDYPREREGLISRFISENSPVTRNLPRIGPARLVSERLAEGPFSDFYEFEKILARSLHPLLAGLNLNVIADLQVNALFEKKYRRYAKLFQRVLAGNRTLTPGAMKGLVLDMVAHDGHYMVVKFYDLVIRPLNPGLFREVKPVELAVIDMKNGLTGDAARDEGMVRGILGTYGKNYGAGAAGLLAERASWDDELSEYIEGPGVRGYDGAGSGSAERAEARPGEPDEGGEEAPADEERDRETEAAAGGEYAGEEASAPEDAILLEEISSHESETGREGTGPGEEPGREAGEPPATDRPAGAGGGRIARYAEILKADFLILKRPDDEEGIRGLVQGIYAKNEMRFGADRAAEILHDVLTIWIKDEMLNGWMRGILSDILDERSGTSSVHEGQDDFVPVEDDAAPGAEASGEGDGVFVDDTVEPGSQTAGQGAGAPVDDGIVMDDILVDDGIDGEAATGEAGEATREEADAGLPDTSEEELRALLAGTGEAPVESEPAHEGGDPAAASMRDEIDRIEAEDIVPVVEVSDAENAGGEEFLVSEEEFRELTKPADADGKGASRKDGFLPAGERGEHDGFDDVDLVDMDLEFEAANPAGKRFSARSAAGDEAAPEGPRPSDDAAGIDSFIVKDEILFEDRSLDGRKRGNAEG